MNWFETIPSFLSAVASVAAAIAAIVSLRISKRSTAIAEASALAVHHNSASLEYTRVVRELDAATKDFADFCYSMWEQWASELERKDNRKLGGRDPRPLRHVLTNGSEMLANYGFNNTVWGCFANQAILSPIRHGMGSLDDNEYQKLLEKADHTYHDFEGVFGAPSKSSAITSAPAFRWVCHQLIKRVKEEDWKKSWQEAWSDNGWLTKYQAEYSKIKPKLDEAQTALKFEKAKLAHTAFPLRHNSDLSSKYDEILKALEHLQEDCHWEHLETYKDWPYSEEQSQLVLCSMATARFAMMQLNTMYSND